MNLEQQIIGSFIHSVDALSCLSKLSETDFLENSNRELFKAIKKLAETNQPVDLTTLLDAVDSDYECYVYHISQNFISSVNIEKHIDRLRDKSRRAEIIDANGKFNQDIHSGVDIDEAIGELYQKIGSLDYGGRIVGMETAVPKAISDFKKRKENKGKHILRTGYPCLDDDLLITGDKLIILAARPSVGKSAFAINIGENMSRLGYNVFVYSLEMKHGRIIDRMFARNTRQNYKAIQEGAADLEKIEKIEKELLCLPIKYDEKRNVTLSEIISECRRMKTQNRLDILIIDYIQLVRIKRPCSIYERVTEVSRELKILAGELDIPIIALCQLNRLSTDRQDPRPQLFDLRDSGAIEQDADAVLMLHRPYAIGKGTDPEEAELYIRKNRGGVLSGLHYKFDGAHQEFKERTKTISQEIRGNE